ncbi:MAG: type II toxin-antitoxin system Phd/YefM family antitoxin, partial [Bacillota bacterium]
LALKTVINNIIPVSRFNRGEASKIFDEVIASGTKVVLKNNTPTCFLVSPEEYTVIMDELEDLQLFKEAATRLSNPDAKVYSENEVMTSLGISDKELADAEVSLE